MDLDAIRAQRQEILQKLSELSNDDLKAIEKLIERHQDIIKLVKKEEAWGMVFSTIRTSALWITVVIGAIYMGIDKFSAFVKGLLL